MAKLDAKIVEAALLSADYTTQRYSGRGMSGLECVGVEVETLNEMFEMFVLLAEDDSDLAAEMARSARTDSLGHNKIVYWPNAKFETKPV